MELHSSLFLYVSSAKGKRHPNSQAELARFVRWCGRSVAWSDVHPTTIERYAETVRATGSTDARGRLQWVRTFLTFAYSEGWTAQNLANHLRMRRIPGEKMARGSNAEVEMVHLTADGHSKLEDELRALKGQRVVVAKDIQKAAADKDVRENAPLDAAREKQGFLEARIREIEKTLRSSRILGDGDVGVIAEKEGRVALGRIVLVKDSATGHESKYRLVDPREAQPLEGKLSIESPVGKALVGRKVGDDVKVNAPRGIIRYLVVAIQ